MKNIFGKVNWWLVTTILKAWYLIFAITVFVLSSIGIVSSIELHFNNLLEFSLSVMVIDIVIFLMLYRFKHKEIRIIDIYMICTLIGSIVVLGLGWSTINTIYLVIVSLVWVMFNLIEKYEKRIKA